MFQRFKSMARFRAGQPPSPQETRSLAVVPMDYGNGELLIHVDSEFERTTRTIPCAKEPDTIKWIETLMKPSEVIFDIGANVGNYSLIIARHLNKNTRIFAFEPAWFNFMQLNRNVVLNGFENCIFPMCAALSQQTGISWLNYSTLEYGSSLHSLGKAVRLRDQKFSPALRQPVASFSVDETVKLLDTVPNHIKIDVDGLETEILSGAADTLANPSLKSILVEFCSDNPADQEAIQGVLSAGFKVWNIEQKPRNEIVNFAAYANYIFVR